MFPIKDDAPAGKFPLVNLALIGITVYVFLQELIAPNLNLFLAKWALIPAMDFW